MDKSTVKEKSTIELIQKFRRDLFRFNDPTIQWNEGERYYQCLVWGRATLTFGASLAVIGLLAWSYVQLRQDPHLRFWQSCQQRGIDTVACNSQWERVKP